MRKPIKKPASRPVSLNVLGSVSFANNSKQEATESCPLLALYSRDLKPAAGVRVRYRVIQGPLKLGKEKKNAVLVKTNKDGKVTVQTYFASHGYAIVAADLPSDPNTVVFFEGHTEGMTHRLFIYSLPFFPPNETIRCKITALDHHGNPVKSTKLAFEGHFGIDTTEIGEVDQTDSGEFVGFLHAKKAGLWNLLVQDLNTKVSATTYVHVMHGPPDKIIISGDTDPTSTRPRNELLLRAVLQDSFGNPLDPHRIRCNIDGVVARPYCFFANEAVFLVKFLGYSGKKIRLYDDESHVSMETKVFFPAAWLELPNPIILDSEYKTLLYGNPEAHRPITKASVLVKYDPNLTSFKRIEEIPSSGIHVSAEKGHGSITIEIESKTPHDPKDSPEGFPICYLHWKCEREGETCFEVIADR